MMRTIKSLAALRVMAALGMCLCMAACGGGGSDLAGGGTSSSSSGGSSSSSGASSSSSGASSSSGVAGSNTIAVVVDAGPSNNSTNTPFITVTLCVPGTSQCQTIDHIEVDTGSYGFRVLSSVLTLTLPGANAPDGGSLQECTAFVDGYSWGSVASATLKVAGETAASLPIQVIGDGKYAVPSACSGSGPKAENTVATFGANGIIGIGVFEQDCGVNCTVAANAASIGLYYSCSTAGCSPTQVPLTSQVLNPIPLFATDNNGSIITFPSVASEGAVTVSGTLIFGVDTQTNNASGTRTVIAVDDNQGYFTASVDNMTMSQSFIDTGSNAYFFDDSNIQACGDTVNFGGFYCPGSTLSFTATVTGSGLNPNSASIAFNVGSASAMLQANASFSVFPMLAGCFSDTCKKDQSLDFGLPFYLGRSVVTAIEQKTTAVGTGPYVAF